MLAIVGPIFTPMLEGFAVITGFVAKIMNKWAEYNWKSYFKSDNCLLEKKKGIW